MSLSSIMHIDTAIPSASGKLPKSPFEKQTLPPDAKLTVPLESATAKAAHLGNLADAMDETRTRLNAVLTSWKDWAGKEPDSMTGLKVERRGGIRKDEDDDQDEEE